MYILITNLKFFSVLHGLATNIQNIEILNTTISSSNIFNNKRRMGLSTSNLLYLHPIIAIQSTPILRRVISKLSIRKSSLAIPIDLP